MRNKNKGQVKLGHHDNGKPETISDLGIQKVIEKLKAVHPEEERKNELAEFLFEAIESLPHCQRLYPELYANSLAELIEEFWKEKRPLITPSGKVIYKYWDSKVIYDLDELSNEDKQWFMEDTDDVLKEEDCE